MTVINWFPGHMAKAGRQVKEQAALCDLILEIADAPEGDVQDSAVVPDFLSVQGSV